MEKQTEQKTNEKIKVTDIDIICVKGFRGTYYEIKYKKVGEQVYTIGYGSYDIDNVMKWKEEYFELVEEEQREQKETDNTNKDIMERMDNIEMALSCILTNQMSQMVLSLENDKLKEKQRELLNKGLIVTQQVVQDILKRCIQEEVSEDKFLKALEEILK